MGGTGTVKGPPDMADISGGVTTEAPTAAAALTANTAAMNRVGTALDVLVTPGAKQMNGLNFGIYGA